jgi:four helix bundle protein
MPTIMRFEEIEAWQTARELTKLVYTLTEQGAFARDFGLRDQVRRAAVSVMSNIAEGFESQTQPQFIRYLGTAKASAGEVRSQLYVSQDLGYITEEQFSDASRLAEKASRQVSRFMTYLESHPEPKQVREDSLVYEVQP